MRQRERVPTNVYECRTYNRMCIRIIQPKDILPELEFPHKSIKREKNGRKGFSFYEMLFSAI